MNLFAYVDETGDLGDIHVSPKSSPHFGMAALICDDTGAKGVRALVNDLKTEFNVPQGKNLSWKDHVRTHERRKYVAQRLAALAGVQVLYVYTDKHEVTGGYTRDRGYLYNYVAGKLFKNLLWAGRNWGAGDGELTIRFSHVKKFDHTLTDQYLMQKIAPRDNLPDNLIKKLEWVDARKYRESDAADLFAGCLKDALWPDDYGNVEGAYLNIVWPLVRHSHQCSEEGRFCAIPLGFMPMPTYGQVKKYDWFNCASCKQAV